MTSYKTLVEMQRDHGKNKRRESKNFRKDSKKISERKMRKIERGRVRVSYKK